MSDIDSKENDNRVLLKLKQTEPGFYKSIVRMSKSHEKLTKENAGLRSKLGRVQKENGELAKALCKERDNLRVSNLRCSQYRQIIYLTHPLVSDIEMNEQTARQASACDEVDKMMDKR